MGASHLVQTQFQLNTWVLESHLEGISEEESFQADSQGNCLNWVLGHILYTRDQRVLGLLGSEPTGFLDLERYARGSKALANSDEGQSLASLREMIPVTSDGISKSLKALSDSWWEEKAPFSFTQNPEETQSGLIGGFAFHEAYHCGQIALLRRWLGKPGLIQ